MTSTPAKLKLDAYPYAAIPSRSSGFRFISSKEWKLKIMLENRDHLVIISIRQLPVINELGSTRSGC